jgi:hypothetical protein
MPRESGEQSSSRRTSIRRRAIVSPTNHEPLTSLERIPCNLSKNFRR